MRTIGISAAGCVLLMLLTAGCDDESLLPPSSPYDLTAEAVSETEVELAWVDGSTVEYGFELFESAGDSNSFIAVAETPPNTSEWLLDGRTPETNYYYRVRAFNDAGYSAFSNTAATATTDLPPSPPGNLTAVVRNGTDVLLRWVDRSSIEQGYRVYQALEVDTGFVQVAQTPPDADSLLVADLEPLTDYYFHVRAFNEFGESRSAETGAVTTGEQAYTLDIFTPLEEPVVNVNQNLPIYGSVTTIHGTPRDGVKVFFDYYSPENVQGAVTPWSWTDPSQENGFRTTVVFVGRSPGLARIDAWILDSEGFRAATDSLWVRVWQE